MSASDATRERPGRIRRWLDRVVLGALMSLLVFGVERRLRKLVHRTRGSERRPTTVHLG